MQAVVSLYRMLLLNCLLLMICSHSFAQNRQPDSLKRKQQLMISNQLKQVQKQKELDAMQNNKTKGTVVVAYDSKGNKVESYTSKEGAKVESVTDKNGNKSTSTTIILPPVFNKKFNADTILADSISIKVIKTKNRLQVLYKGKTLTNYKCVFGANYLEQKLQEGDNRTPEGTFTILTNLKHEKWDKFMLLDYPNEASYVNFEQAKDKGIIPRNARIGGLVGIHGIWANGDNVIDLKHNWTEGCICLKNCDIDELARIIKPGKTKITIVR